MDPIAATEVAPPPPPPRRRQTRGAINVQRTLLFTISFSILSLLKLEPLARNSVQDHNNEIDMPHNRDIDTPQLLPKEDTAQQKQMLQNLHLNGVDSVIKKHGRAGRVPWIIADWYQETDSNPQEENFDCEMTTFESSVTHKEAEICVHTSSDLYVSDSIRREKRWMDCNVLPSLWNESQKHFLGRVPVYLEIGANIGSCVMEMLLETNAQIIAIEPHPMNLYNLKRSIMNMAKKYKDRIRVIPVGLGNKTSTDTIYAPVGNMGNAIIGKKVKDFGKQRWDQKLSYTVNIERLDSILRSENIHIKLVKMDAQGFECNILEGMGSALAMNIDILKFEYTEKFLHAHECYNLITRVQDYGFNIYQNYKVGADQPFRKYLAQNERPRFESELFAVRRQSRNDNVKDFIDNEESEDDSNDNFCGNNFWSGTQISCQERVKFLVRSYEMSDNNAKVSLLDNGCQCR